MLQGHLNIETAMPIEAGENPDVLFDLGLLFASGRGAPVDLVAAHKWFNLAALKGRTDAIAYRRELAELMSSDEIAVAQREARAWIASH
ncbi:MULTISPECIES: sel1 repeat family protein [Rhodopseudomonas]|uniref:Sel1 domain protein repeat-containing protein n=1 Tax=Rhodopseudomonas palustris (strain DX-1) TaxID=652103 RepID=E6VDI0_RHOPX|nr:MULTISPECIES: sel1 repeat family protein [Rhodopseudomonas]NEW88490.1 sel1 repeat family protein [Rhodopseudomonas sp. WA056]